MNSQKVFFCRRNARQFSDAVSAGLRQTGYRQSGKERKVTSQDLECEQEGETTRKDRETASNCYD